MTDGVRAPASIVAQGGGRVVRQIVAGWHCEPEKQNRKIAVAGATLIGLPFPSTINADESDIQGSDTQLENNSPD